MKTEKTNNTILKTVTSDDDKNIRLYSNTYNMHIIEKHSEYKFDVEEIMEVAKSPEYIGKQVTKRENVFTNSQEEIERELRCGRTKTDQECDYLNIVIEPDQNDEEYHTVVTAFGFGSTTLEKWLKSGKVVKSDDK